MIENTDIDSPFFTVHRNELDSLLNSIKNLNFVINGWCNAYGYEVEISSPTRDFRAKFEKSQLSHQDPLIPRKGTDVYKFRIHCLTDTEGTIAYGKSRLRYIGYSKQSFHNGTIFFKNTDSNTLLKVHRLSEIHGIETIELKKRTIRITGKCRMVDLGKTIDILSAFKKPGAFNKM